MEGSRLIGGCLIEVRLYSKITCKYKVSIFWTLSCTITFERQYSAMHSVKCLQSFSFDWDNYGTNR